MLIVSNTSFVKYPTELFFGILYNSEEDIIGFPFVSPIQGEWGQPTTTSFLLEDKYSIPEFIDTVYLSILERVFYSVESKIQKNKIEELSHIVDDSTGEPLFEQIVVGLAPYGGVSLWLYGQKKEVLIEWIKGEIVDVTMSEFMPQNPGLTLDGLCDYYIKNDKRIGDNLQQNGLPPRDLFDNYMKQFTYRYVIRYEQWDDDDEKWQRYEEDEVQPEYDFIEEMLYDGTHDKLHDGGLLKYHEAGKPKKLALAWHIKKSEYTAYFWFEDERIREVFDRFHGAHPDTKTDFIIRIDPEKRKYELALYRYGLKEPYTIPEDAYQILVFKNKFEDYRSDNYNQERGAWIW